MRAFLLATATTTTAAARVYGRRLTGLNASVRTTATARTTTTTTATATATTTTTTTTTTSAPKKSNTIPPAAIHSDRVALTLPEATAATYFHHEWLRDNCPCPACVHPSTRQKNHSSGDIPPGIRPLRAEWIRSNGKTASGPETAMHQHLDASDPWTLEVEWPAFVPASASPAAGNRTARSMTPTATGTGTHTSRYPASYLRRWSYAQQRGDGYLSPKPQPWSTADPDAITHVDYRDLPPIADLLARAGYDGHNNAMKSVATRSRSHPLPATGALPTSVLDAVARDGLVFFHNVPTSKGDDYVELLARRFGHTLRDTFYGPSWDVKVVPASTNVAYTSVFLGLHMDLMYFEAPPGLQFLHMLRTNVRGGRSLFLDMAHAWQVFACEAPADEVAVLQRVPIHYHYAHAHHHHHHHHHHLESGSTPHWLAHAHPLVSSASSSGMFYAPPFAGPLAPPSPDDVPLWYRAMRRWEDHVRALPMVEIDLRPGDAVLFHNRRVLHGRTAFDADQSQSSPASASASEEETKKHVRHLRGTYVGWDEFADRWRVAQYQK